jgi:hypothetical protein
VQAFPSLQVTPGVGVKTHCPVAGSQASDVQGLPSLQVTPEQRSSGAGALLAVDSDPLCVLAP